MVESKKSFTADEARRIGRQIGIDWESAPFDVEQFRMGRRARARAPRFGTRTSSNDDPWVTREKIALAHLNEFPDYYNRLERMEEEAKRDWSGR